MRIILLLLIVTAGCRESLESHYDTYDAAVADGAIKRGWLPQWLPKSATDIHEWHNIDTNATTASFAYGHEDPSIFLAGCEQENEVRRNPGSSSWWPNDKAWKRIKVHRCEERIVYGDGHVEIHPAWASVDDRERRIYFWR